MFNRNGKRTVNIPAEMWIKCPDCQRIIYRAEVNRNLKVCPKCRYHFRLSWKEWLDVLIDDGTFTEMYQDVKPVDMLHFRDIKTYSKRLEETQKRLQINDAYVCGKGKINGINCVFGVFEFSFLGGSMGVAVGEKIARTFEVAEREKLPVIIVSSSGGARMQEGMFSLMQMAKTVSALASYKENCRKPFISILADPTTGGVSASFAFLGDIVIAESKALIGFAGPRVIEGTIKTQLPPGFQRAEFLLEKGMVDMVIERKELKEKVSTLLKILA